MPTVQYPSPQFPGPPRVALDVPDGWVEEPLAGILLAVRGPQDADQHRPNVVVRATALAPGVTVGAALRELDRLVASKPDGAREDPFAVEVHGRPYVAVNLSWSDDAIAAAGAGAATNATAAATDGRDGTVVQTHLFTVVEDPRRPGTGHLLQLTGTVAGREARAAYGTVLAVLRSARVEEGTR